MFCSHACSTSKHLKHCHIKKSWLSHIWYGDGAVLFFFIDKLCMHHLMHLEWGQNPEPLTQLRSIFANASSTVTCWSEVMVTVHFEVWANGFTFTVSLRLQQHVYLEKLICPNESLWNVPDFLIGYNYPYNVC